MLFLLLFPKNNNVCFYMLFLYAKLTAICMKKHTNEKKTTTKSKTNQKKNIATPPTPQKQTKTLRRFCRFNFVTDNNIVVSPYTRTNKLQYKLSPFLNLTK